MEKKLISNFSNISNKILITDPLYGLYGDDVSDQGYINTNLIRKIWYDHKNGKNDWTGRLWAVLMFQSWYNEKRIK